MISNLIEYTTLVNTEAWGKAEPDHTNVVTISLQATIDFLRAPRQSVVLVNGVPMEYRYAGELMVAAQQYYIAHYPDETRALLIAQGLEPDF